jgi:uroporphyrinogen decarboxylase
MTPREVVRLTLAFGGPDRVARSFDINASGHAEGSGDVIFAYHTAATHATDWTPVDSRRWERCDEWGNGWERIDPTSKGEVTRPVLAELADADSYTFPAFDKPGDYQGVGQTRRAHPNHWLGGCLPGFTFNIARKLRRLDLYLMDLLLERDRIRVLHDRIDTLLIDMIRNYARVGCDAVLFPEDWGTQSQTLIAPGLWREEFYPRFVVLCDEVHRNGMKVMMHSCGQIEAIVPGLIEAGVDCLQFDQPVLHGMDTLAAHQKDHPITFWCPVDIQRTLQTRNEALIRREAREMLETLWRGRGGFIAGYYNDNASIGLEPAWQDIACRTFVEFGKQSA